MNLASVLLGPTERTPDSAALRVGDETVTFSTLADRVQRVAGGLVGLGVEPGERVAIVAANQPAFVAAYLAVLWAGGVAVPLNPTAAPPELARELSDVGAKLAVVGPAGRETFLAAQTTTPVVGAGCEIDGYGSTTWESLCQSDPFSRPVERDDDDLAVLLHTAGTAGVPKAAMLSHGNLAANIRQVQDHPDLHVEPDDIALAILPFFHIYGLNAGMGVMLAAGACQVLVADFDPVSSLALLRSQQVTLVAGVPTMYQAWLDLAETPGDSFAQADSLGLIKSASAILPSPIPNRRSHWRRERPSDASGPVQVE